MKIHVHLTADETVALLKSPKVLAGISDELDAQFPYLSEWSPSSAVMQPNGELTLELTPHAQPIFIEPSPVIKGQASTWGLDPGTGADDKGDVDLHGNPLPGFFTDPSGKEYQTHNKTLIACSIPEHILMATLGLSGPWTENAGKVRKWVQENRPTVTVKSVKTKLVAAGVPIADVGPSIKTRCLDRTYALTHALGGNDPEEVEWQMFLSNGTPVAVKGWDNTKGEWV